MTPSCPSLILACCFVLFWQPGASAGESAHTRYLDYRGDLDRTLAIGLSLADGGDGERLSGTYFYRKHLQDIALEGEYTGVRTVVLREHAADGTLVGTFALHFADRDPRGQDHDAALDKEVLIGDWVSADAAARYPVYLRLTGTARRPVGEGRYAVAGAADDALVERNVQAFTRAVRAGDRKAAARLAAYPVSFVLNGRSRAAASEQELLRYYDRIFTRRFIARIAQGTPHRMFANAEGIMLGDGAVWFNDQGKVSRLNNAVP